MCEPNDVHAGGFDGSAPRIGCQLLYRFLLDVGLQIACVRTNCLQVRILIDEPTTPAADHRIAAFGVFWTLTPNVRIEVDPAGPLLDELTILLDHGGDTGDHAIDIRQRSARSAQASWRRPPSCRYRRECCGAASRTPRSSSAVKGSCPARTGSAWCIAVRRSRPPGFFCYADRRWVVNAASGALCACPRVPT